MLTRTVSLSFFLLTILFGKAQINLVPNSSLEDTTNNCFIAMGFYDNVKHWYNAKESPDYYNSCANAMVYPIASSMPYSCRGYQQARTGVAYGGTALFYMSNQSDSLNISSEWMGAKLVQPLKANNCYYGEFYISLAEISDVGINRIGMLLTQNTYTANPYFYNNSIQPHIKWDTTQCFTDTLNWVKVSGTFIAQGGEEYLTIGNFRDGMNVNKDFINRNFTNVCNITNAQNASYIFVDDIALYEIPAPQLSFNSVIICPDTDSLMLGDTARIQTSYQWFANGSLIANTSSITVKPNQTTSYVLQTTQCNTSTQTVVVTYSANCEPVVVVEPIIPNVFTPNNDSINDVWRFNLGKGNTLKALSIYNRWGNEIAVTSRASVTVINWDGRTTSGEETPGGVYFYVIHYIDPNGEEHKKNGYITLIR